MVVCIVNNLKNEENESQILVIGMISAEKNPHITRYLHVGKFKLKNRIHGKRQHQQGVVVALIGE
jgi:hypothetical protein